MRDLNIPEIEDPDRFFPDPVLVKKPHYEKVDGGAIFHHKGQQERIHPVCADILRGLEAGLGFHAIVAQCDHYPKENLVSDRAIAKIAKKYLWKLHKLGYVHYDLEEPPAVFHGRYERVKELGRGGLGIAHLCKDLETGRDVVVKHPWGMKSKIASGQTAIAIEIHLMQTIEHPSVPALYDSFAVRGLLHMVREFVDGRKLSAIYGPRSTATRDERIQHARQVVEVLALIHDAGWLFFDPSPDNFFVATDGRLMATDLGGCKPHDNGRIDAKGPRGTAGYVAPELRRKKDCHASLRSDIYSIGCLYYYMTTGHRPSRTWRHTEIKASIEAEVEDPRDRKIIDRLTRDDPDERPPTMHAVLDLLW